MLTPIPCRQGWAEKPFSYIFFVVATSNGRPGQSLAVSSSLGFDPHSGRVSRTHPEPLGTVDGDSSIEWGMVVIDVTNLDAICYGIVGFHVGSMKHAASPSDLKPYIPLGGFEMGGTPRAVDDERPMVPMSVVDHVAKFAFDKRRLHDDFILSLFDGKPLIDPSAIDLVWPAGKDAGSVPPSMKMHEPVARSNCQQVLFLENPTRESDEPSAQTSIQLSQNPSLLQRVSLMVAGSYSAALRKEIRLLRPLAPIELTISGSHDVVHPVQQMLWRHQHSSCHGQHMELGCLQLTKEFLTPKVSSVIQLGSIIYEPSHNER